MKNGKLTVQEALDLISDKEAYISNEISSCRERVLEALEEYIQKFSEKAPEKLQEVQEALDKHIEISNMIEDFKKSLDGKTDWCNKFCSVKSKSFNIDRVAYPFHSHYEIENLYISCVIPDINKIILIWKNEVYTGCGDYDWHYDVVTLNNLEDLNKWIDTEISYSDAICSVIANGRVKDFEEYWEDDYSCTEEYCEEMKREISKLFGDV